MDYNEPYLTIRFNGVTFDTPAYDLPMDTWSSIKNIRFNDGKTEKCTGEAPVFGTPSTSPNWLTTVNYGANYYWIYSSVTAVYVTDMADNHYNITPASLTAGDVDMNWNGGLINNIVVMNNGAQAPIWWTGDTGSVMTVLPNWTAGYTAKVVRPYKSYLVAMNVYDGSAQLYDQVLWSDAAAPGYVPDSWDVSDPTKDAGQTELSDTPGEIIDGLQLSDTFIIYKQKSCYSMQFVGGQYIFKFRKLFENIGALSTDCVVNIPGRQHLVLTSDDLILHDGVSFKSIIDNRVKKWLFSVINQDYYDRSFIVPNYEDNEVWVCVPTGSNEYADTAIVWNYDEDKFGFRDLPEPRFIAAGVVDPSESNKWDDDSDSWASDQTFWDERTFSPTASSLLIGDRASIQFLEANKTNTFDGDVFQSYAVRESMPFLDRHNFKLIKSVYPRFESTSQATVKIRIGVQDHATDSIDWGTEQDFIIGVDDKVDVLMKGRYVSFQVLSDTDINWKLNTVDFEVELAERF